MLLLVVKNTALKTQKRENPPSAPQTPSLRGAPLGACMLAAVLPALWLAPRLCGILLGISLAAALVVQYVAMGAAFARSGWVAKAANVFLPYTALLLFTLLFNRLPPALLLFCEVVGILTVVNKVKMTYLKEPVTASDFTSTAEALDVARLYVGAPLLALLAALLLLGAAGVVLLCVQGGEPVFSSGVRIAGLAWATVCCALSWRVALHFQSGAPREAGPRETARDYGCFVALLGSFAAKTPQAPPGYSQQLFTAQLGKNTGGKALPNIKPNILLILLESAIDPCEITEPISFNEDPIPNLRALRRQGYVRRMVSSEKGGKTANVEFEALTGLSMAFLPESSTPYKDSLVQPGFASLPRQLAAQGYETAALHLNHGKFWSRNMVYRNLGFSQFLSLDTLGKETCRISKTGTWARDDALAGLIAGRAEQAQAPLFLFALTVENHGPYLQRKYPPEEMHLRAELGGAYAPELSVFAQGLHHTDALLGRLIRHFSAMDTPTAIVFFGDHAPTLPRTPVAGLEYLTMPCGFWTNFGIPAPSQQIFSASYLPEILLGWLGLEKGPWFCALEQHKQALPVNARGWLVDSEGNALPELTPAMRKAREELAVLNYGALFGEGNRH